MDRSGFSSFLRLKTKEDQFLPLETGLFGSENLAACSDRGASSLDRRCYGLIWFLVLTENSGNNLTRHSPLRRVRCIDLHSVICCCRGTAADELAGSSNNRSLAIPSPYLTLARRTVGRRVALRRQLGGYFKLRLTTISRTQFVDYAKIKARGTTHTGHWRAVARRRPPACFVRKFQTTAESLKGVSQ